MALDLLEFIPQVLVVERNISIDRGSSFHHPLLVATTKSGRPRILQDVVECIRIGPWLETDTINVHTYFQTQNNVRKEMHAQGGP